MKKCKRPVLLTLYVTERCQARCGFCNIWKKEDPRDADPALFRDILKEARSLFGPIFVDFTGGEPLLYEPLPELLKTAKELGFKTSVTTNTLLYPRRAEEIAGLVDFLLFSLDGTREFHDRNRGIAAYDRVLESLDKARSLGEWPDLLMTVTHDNIKMIPHVASVAATFDLILQINPVFSYFGNEGLSLDDISLVNEYAVYSKIYMNRAQMRLIASGGNRSIDPRCRAVSSQVVINPEGEMLLPCYHKAVDSIPVAGSLEKACGSSLRRWYEKRQGSFDFCEGCTINCSFDPSFEYHLDRLMVSSLSGRAKYAWLRYGLRPLKQFFNRLKRGR
ncbi:MAG TPA: radical SAM protein [Candidatus Mcinerneyibacteriales bacterium]|nr:radical SAM protein [Candidatus Mcinerneyibacteriales bacterium]